ncbi:site-specific integrase [Kaistella sp. G5-32]|uniref:Site-specific integrase n=1 Tax=Kaistella gelatinilytica TaxID=2787636 RepID=A0ABS0FBR8_9FLAO|nr:phage integrase SAM-like domain-containing protein [Kaistella gelatinilytica]MBF8457153.1 site-specific integrase [Kaistella gelatinilytica]
MNIGFFLKEPHKTTETMLYITASLSGKRIKRSTGVKIKPSNWTGVKVKTLAADSESKNLKIDKVVNIFKEIEREYLLKNIPLSKDILEKEFDNRIKPKPKTISKSFFDIFNEFIEIGKDSKSVNTIRTFNTCKKHLKAFGEEENLEITFDMIDLSFYDDLLAYFYEKGFLNSTIGKYIKLLKTFMQWSKERSFHTNIIYKKFLVFKDDSEKIKLNADVVEKLRITDFGDEYQNIVRDIFILSCYTGLRFVDIQNLKPENIVDDFIRVHIQKTKENLDIPLMKVSKEIIDKQIKMYGRIKVPTNQFCNREIKKMFAEIGFNSVIEFTKHSGSKNIVIKKSACDYLTMHYGRVFFVTNSLVNGMGEEFVREITGHKDYKSFKKYVQFSKEMIAEKLLIAWEK